MLNDVDYVQESIAINLYYLRTLREFCLNIQTSLIPFQTAYIKEAESIALECEALGSQIASFASGLVSSDALDYQIYVTNYTLECEELTEKLFNVQINTDITKKELELKPGNPTSVSSELKKIMEDINNEAYNLADRFVTLSRKVLDGMTSNEIFSYSYILVDPKNSQISNEANWFENEFTKREEAYKVTALTPENQKNLTEKESILVGEFHNFMEKCIRELLTRNAYFIIEPIFLDNMYTQINFFQYILNYNKKNQ